MEAQARLLGVQEWSGERGGQREWGSDCSSCAKISWDDSQIPSAGEMGPSARSELSAYRLRKRGGVIARHRGDTRERPGGDGVWVVVMMRGRGGRMLVSRLGI